MSVNFLKDAKKKNEKSCVPAVDINVSSSTIIFRGGK